MFRRCFLWAVQGILAGSASALAGAADEPWATAAFTANPQAILQAVASSPTPSDADVEILYSEVTYQFDAQNRRTCTYYEVYRWLTEQAVQESANVEAGWAPWCEERPSIRARVITPDGAVHPLDANIIAEVPSDQQLPYLLSDRKLLRAPLPAAKVGAVAEQQYVVRETKPFFSQGSTGRFIVGRMSPVRKLRLILEAPRSIPLQYRVEGSELKPQRSEQNGQVRLVFEAGPLKELLPPEACLPPDMPRFPQIVFATGRSWPDIATSYAAVADPQIRPELVKSTVQEILGKETRREQIIAKLLAYVQQMIRYTGVEFGDAEIVPHLPQETLARRYGDCKDQAALLVAMLRAAGLRADIALLSAGSGADIAPDMPGLGMFNHAIVYVVGNPPFWLDSTARFVPAWRLPLSDEGRWALVIDQATRKLVRTPRSDYRQNRRSEVYEYFLTEGEGGRARETVSGSGTCEVGLRNSFTMTNPEDLRKGWKDYAQRRYHSSSLARLRYPSPQDTSKPFRVTAEVDDAVLGEVNETEIVISLSPSPLFDHLPNALTEVEPEDKETRSRYREPLASARVAPLLVPEPHLHELQFRITPPPAFVPRPLPQSETRQFGPVTIGWNYEWKDGAVVATFRLDTGPGTLTAEETRDLRRGILALGTHADPSRWNVTITFDNMATQHLAAGTYKALLSECRQSIAKQSDQAEPHWRYAHALLRAGQGEAARLEARRAVALTPDSAGAHAALARVLTCNLLGDNFRPGMDWPGAAAAYRKALELKPTSSVIRNDYAILLEHNEDGWRYAPNAKLDEAVTQYRKLQEQAGPTEGVSLALGLLLMHCEKFAEAEQVAQQMKSSEGHGLLLAAVAARQNSAEAEQKAGQFGSGEDRRHALAWACDCLDRTRLYEQASALTEKAVVGTLTESTWRSAKTPLLRRLDEVSLSGADPRYPVRQLLLAVLQGGQRLQQLEAMFAQGASAEDRTLLIEQARAPWLYLMKLASTRGLSPQRIGDVVSLLQITSEGEDATGFRVRVGGLEATDVPAYYYVIFEQGAPRLFAPGRLQANLGVAALACLARGDVPSARLCLEWAWQEHKEGIGWLSPFSGSAFGQLWRAADDSDPQHITLAAAALACEGSPPKNALEVLQEARRRSSAATLLQIDRALAAYYLRVGQAQDGLVTAARLFQEHPESQELLRLQANALLSAGRQDELRQFLHVVLGRNDLDMVTRIVLSQLAATIGEIELAQERLRPLAERDNVLPGISRDLAWYAVLRGAVDNRALDDAKRADEQTRHSDPSCLGTLATVYAELEKPAEALDSLRECVRARSGEITPADWYVLGRIAELCGLEEIATTLYQRVPRAKQPSALDAAPLAQRRLRGLAKP